MLDSYSGSTARATSVAPRGDARPLRYRAATAVSAMGCCKIVARVANWDAKSKANVAPSADGNIRVEVKLKNERPRIFCIKATARLRFYKLLDLQDRFDSIVSFRSDVPRNFVCDAFRAGLVVVGQNARRPVSL